MSFFRELFQRPQPKVVTPLRRSEDVMDEIIDDLDHLGDDDDDDDEVPENCTCDDCQEARALRALRNRAQAERVTWSPNWIYDEPPQPEEGTTSAPFVGLASPLVYRQEYGSDDYGTNDGTRLPDNNTSAT